jgi:predicted phosphodiesterase
MKKVIKLQTWLIIPDTHIQAPRDDGQFNEPQFCHHPAAISLMLQYIKNFKLDGIIHIGDLMEMDCISHWTKAVGREGQIKDTKGDWYAASWKAQKKMAYSFWEYLSKTHPDAVKVQLEGNHDQWSRTFFSHPMFSQFDDEDFNPQKLAFHNWSLWKDLNIKYIPYWGGETDSNYIIRAPGYDRGLVVMHGFNNASVKKMYKDFDNVVYGHQHKVVSETYDGNYWEDRAAHCIGCLTKLKAEYNSNGGARNAWKHAFALVNLYSDNVTQVRVVRIHRDLVVGNEAGETFYPMPLASIDPTLSVLDY